MAPPGRRREEGMRREPEAPRGSRGRPLSGALAGSVEPGPAAGDDEGPRSAPPRRQDPEYRREQLRGPRSRRGALPSLPCRHRLKPGALQHAPASDRGGGPPLLQTRGDRDLGMESDRERDPLRQVPRREEAQRPDPRGRGSLQTREPTSNGPPDPRAPEDRTGPSKDPRPGRARLASPPSARHPDSGCEASVSIGGERGRRGVVLERQGNPYRRLPPASNEGRHVLKVRRSYDAASQPPQSRQFGRRSRLPQWGVTSRPYSLQHPRRW